jgi:predicted nucleic acid-binding protein
LAPEGLAPAFAGIVLAATARCHRLQIVTRNTRHLEPLCVPTVNPFDRLPSGRGRYVERKEVP